MRITTPASSSSVTLQGPTPSVDEDGGDSDCCNMGSPTAASAGSARSGGFVGTANLFHETASIAATQAQHTANSCARHVAYQVRGTAAGLRRYLLDACSLQLLLLSPAALTARQNGVSISGGAAPRPCGCRDVEEDEVAVGTVAVPLTALAEGGADEGAQLCTRCSELTINVTYTMVKLYKYN